MIKEGDEAQAAVSESGRRTTSRRELSTRHPQFGDISPEVGELDEGRFDQLIDESTDQALALLADLTSATDERLRELARRLAGRILVDIARAGVARSMGVGRIRSRRGGVDGDLDLDASLETVVSARASRTT